MDMRRSLMIAAMAALLLVVWMAPAGATQPSDVTIEVEEDFIGSPAPFQASGPAVDDGLICETGTVVETSAMVTGISPNGFNWLGIKHFTCDDFSGEFFVRMQAKVELDGGSTFRWAIVDGTGDYAGLHGSGSGVGLSGVPCGDPDLCILDVYEGGLH
jgi:hypothetical protein